MDFIPENPLLQFNADTLQFVRKQCDMDNIDKLKKSIDTFYEWIQKQEHFMKKDYSEEYLERMIIVNQGSIERAKKRLNLLCTFKTMLPKYFEPFNMDNSYLLNVLDCGFLPQMTKDYYRVFMLKNRGQRYDTGILDFFKYFIMINEYFSAHDYANGLIGIFDYTENNVTELTKAINFVELQQALTIVAKGYLSKVKGIHFLTRSNAIDTYISLLKKALVPKLGQLIQVHKDVNTIYEYVPKDIMPIDYGGNEKPLKELSGETLEVLKSAEFRNYFHEMKLACTNESLRKKDIYNDSYMGMPGSLKMVVID